MLLHSLPVLANMKACALSFLPLHVVSVGFVVRTLLFTIFSVCYIATPAPPAASSAVFLLIRLLETIPTSLPVALTASEVQI